MLLRLGAENLAQVSLETYTYVTFMDRHSRRAFKDSLPFCFCFRKAGEKGRVSLLRRKYFKTM